MNHNGYDKETEKWFKNHPDAQTTVMQCDKCGLFYKPSLGHKCKYAPKSNNVCETCKANKVCNHDKFGFENCGNYIPDKTNS